MLAIVSVAALLASLAPTSCNALQVIESMNGTRPRSKVSKATNLRASSGRTKREHRDKDRGKQGADGIQATGNLCAQGKLLPEFYLLGAPKCATTSFSMELGRYGHVREAPHLWSPKEWHFWEKFPIGADAEDSKKRFFQALGECPSTRLALGDYSINNLAAVPVPSGVDLTPCSCNKVPQVARFGGDAPRLLKHAYGEFAQDITLMVMLREPLARIQSSWYHAKSQNFARFWGFRDCCTKSFQGAVDRIVKGARVKDDGIQSASEDVKANGTESSPLFGHFIGGEGSVWASLYGRHIAGYLQYFNASQMVVVPYKQYTGGERGSICHRVEKRLKTQMNCSNAEYFTENVHKHGSLEEEIPQPLRESFNRLMAPEVDILVDVLTKAHAAGAELANYEGPAGNLEAVRAWLLASW